MNEKSTPQETKTESETMGDEDVRHQVIDLTAERDDLRSQLSDARGQIEALEQRQRLIQGAIDTVTVLEGEKAALVDEKAALAAKLEAARSAVKELAAQVPQASKEARAVTEARVALAKAEADQVATVLAAKRAEQGRLERMAGMSDEPDKETKP